MDGFKRPTKPGATPLSSPKVDRTAPSASPASKQPVQLPPIDLPSLDLENDNAAKKNTRSRGRRRWPFVMAGLVAALLLALAGAYVWYQAQLAPVDANNTTVQRVEIKDGSSLSFVADRLKERGLIRNETAFLLFVNMQGKQTALKAGTCNIAPSDSAQQILDKLTAGCHDFVSVTFYPGATLEPSLYAQNKAAAEGKEFKDMSIRASLQLAGFDDNEIDEAFSSAYNTPLFAGKPDSEGYEGYIFGETYFVDPAATAKEILQTAFDHMYTIVASENLEVKFREQGLSLYEGITLASIVGRELDCEGKPTEERKQVCYNYQRQIASVFYNRLAAGMTLGSDVTSIYASDKLGVPSTVDVDSPYNTRRYAGLTPGPIATPGKLALLSVANPTESDDLFFLAGDDGLIYFAKDTAGHERNIVEHCKIGCGSL